MSRIFIGRIASRTKQEDIEDLFKRFGEIKRFDFKLGFAFIEYADKRDAEDAIRDMNGQVVDEAAIVVETAKGPRENAPTRTGGAPLKTGLRIRVEGLSSDTSWQDLKDFARTVGRPLYTDVFADGYEKVGVVEFETEQCLEAALSKLHGQSLKGKVVSVTEEGKDGGGRGRGRDRDGANGDSFRGRGGGGYDNRGGRDGGRDYDREYSRDSGRDNVGRGDYRREERGGGGGRDYDRDRPRDSRDYDYGRRDEPPVRRFSDDRGGRDDYRGGGAPLDRGGHGQSWPEVPPARYPVGGPAVGPRSRSRSRDRGYVGRGDPRYDDRRR